MNTPAIAVEHGFEAPLSEIPGCRLQAVVPVRGKGRPILVVGDKFREFSVGMAVLTISQLRGLLDIPAGLTLCEPMFLIPGQGLGEKDIDSVLARAGTTIHRDRLDFSLWHQMPRRAELTLSHKHRVENTLISVPRRLADDLFELDLLIDENSELMEDHQTGLHLQGMLLVEAARQAFLAVTEVFFLPQDGTKFYFVFNTLSADYKRFAFPIATRLHYRVRERDDSTSNPRFTIDVMFEQAAVDVATVSGSFTVVKSRSVSKMEQSLAKDAIKNHYAALVAMNVE